LFSFLRFLVSIGLSTVLYAGAAVMGYKMFGEATESQFTLNLPDNSVVSKVAVWTTVIFLPKSFQIPYFKRDKGSEPYYLFCHKYANGLLVYLLIYK